MKNIWILAALLALMSYCRKDNNPGKAGNIINPGFESDIAQSGGGWENSGTDADAGKLTNVGRTGSHSLYHFKSTAYKVYTYQKIEGLENGIYSLVAYSKNTGGQNACYMIARNYGDTARMTSLPVSNAWKRIIIRGIEVTNGTCEIGFYSDAGAGNSCTIDDVVLTKDGISYTFLKGGDISELTYIESKGGKFYDQGAEKNCLEILKDNGFNIVRLRLYNDPGNPAFSPSNRLPANIQNPADILSLAKRAKDFDMQILLTFYYSDYWSNDKTHLWEGISFAALKDSVYQFTWSFMNKMKAQGTTPEFVSLGNEISGGFLKPDGASSNFAQMAELIEQGYSAVKAVSPKTQVVLHLDDAGNKAKYDWFFGECGKYGVSYDIIGASYYPFWTNRTVYEITSWADYESSKFNKQILIMETGYNWNPTLPDGKTGQLANNGPYNSIYPSSPQGQLNFLYECFNGIKNVQDGKLLGDLYWDPVMIEVSDVGWELGADNVVSNTTLFDFNGNALPALKAFKYNN